MQVPQSASGPLQLQVRKQGSSTSNLKTADCNERPAIVKVFIIFNTHPSTTLFLLFSLLLYFPFTCTSAHTLAALADIEFSSTGRKLRSDQTRMRFSLSLAAFWLAACAFAGPDTSSTDADGIRSIPVGLDAYLR